MPQSLPQELERLLSRYINDLKDNRILYCLEIENLGSYFRVLAVKDDGYEARLHIPAAIVLAVIEGESSNPGSRFGFLADCS